MCLAHCRENLDICDCACHSVPGVVHCVPCCKSCPHCGADIKTHAFDSHVACCAVEMAQQTKQQQNEGECLCHYCGEKVPSSLYDSHLSGCREKEKNRREKLQVAVCGN